MQGSFLLPFKSGLSECRNTVKGFAFVIQFSHGSCENIQRDEELFLGGFQHRVAASSRTRSPTKNRFSPSWMTIKKRFRRAHREHTAASHPVRQDGANPTRAGSPLALDSEIPLLAFVGRIPRTGFSPDAAVARCEALLFRLPVGY